MRNPPVKAEVGLSDVMRHAPELSAGIGHRVGIVAAAGLRVNCTGGGTGASPVAVSRRVGVTHLEATSAWRLDPLETKAGGPERGVQRPT